MALGRFITCFFESTGNPMHHLGVIIAIPIYLVGCGVSPGEPPPPAPVVQLVLVVGDSTHRATITWSATPDSTIPQPALPVDPALVDLIVTGPGGAAPLLPDGAPGEFRVDLQGIPGGAYSLRGTVAGQPFEGTTVLPLKFALATPRQDTVSLSTLVPEFLGPGLSSFRAPIEASGIESIDFARFHPPDQMLIVVGGGLSDSVVLRGRNREMTDWATSFFRLVSPLREGTGVIGGVIELRFIVVP